MTRFNNLSFCVRRQKYISFLDYKASKIDSGVPSCDDDYVLCGDPSKSGTYCIPSEDDNDCPLTNVYTTGNYLKSNSTNSH